MRQDYLVGIAAGLASVVMSASLLTGSQLAVPLAILAPIAIVIASLGWGSASGFIAAATAAIVSGIAFQSVENAIWTAVTTGSLAWLSHLIGLARRDDETDQVEWYPLGMVVFQLAIATGLLAAILTAIGGFNASTTADVILKWLQEFIKQSGGQLAVPEAELKRAAESAAKVFPIIAAAAATLYYILYLWLGARIMRRFERLARPWEDLSALQLPPLSAMVFAASVVLWLVPGQIGFLAGFAVGAFGLVFMLTGLAVVHTVTRGVPARPLILIAAYGSILFTLGTFMLAALMFTILGLAETFLNIRQRRQPPSTGGGLIQ